MTSSTLIKSFERAKEDDRAALLTYTVGGDPDKKTSLNIFKSIAESGADIIECGLGHGANIGDGGAIQDSTYSCLLYTSPSPRDPKTSRMPSSA